MASMNMTAKGRTRNYGAFERMLVSQREELRRRLSERLDEVAAEREPDDEAAAAIENSSKDLALATLERERRTLAEIEAALGRMKAGEYGVCMTCEQAIPEARLRALPWARWCVACAEQAAERKSRDLAAD
jgi:DnaK suppressor protein